jgi:transposase
VTGLAQPLTLEIALGLIAELRALVAQQAQTIELQARRIAAQDKHIAKQDKRIAKLEEKGRKNSTNSSKPPSSDGPGKKKKAYPPKQPSGRSRGGQPGHTKHERILLPVEKARSVRDVKPTSCEACGKKLRGDDPCPKRHQIVDLPPIEPVFDEVRFHTLPCPDGRCGHRTEAPWPDDVSPLGFGPGVDAMVGQLTGELRLSKQTTSDTLANVFGVTMSVGAVIDAQTRVSEALKEPCEEALVHAQAQDIKNADETGWWEANKKAYIWTLVTTFVTVFLIIPSRAATAAGTLLGTVRGILGTDRYSGYSWWPTRLRQVCWAHLIRDFVAIAERGGTSKALGEALGAEAQRMFAWWKRLKDGELKRATFQVYMRSVRARVEGLLLQGCSDTNPRTAGTCREMWNVREAFWTFARIEGVEPTNNAAERSIRFGVLWRRMSHGTMSKKGSEFVARILTVHATLRQQERSVHAFLRTACAAHRAKRAPPSLLPHTGT